MFSEIDKIIFPDSCEVIEIVPSQQYVYPIFKCGRSSLFESMQDKGWRFCNQDEIQAISVPITIFLREPQQRFISGVNTFMQHLHKENQNLDPDTVMYFVNRYLFLNRHYAPQFFWIMNLCKFVNADTKIQLCHVKEISLLTSTHSHAQVDPITEELQQKINSYDWSNLELYFYLDQIIFDHIGQTMCLKDLIKIVKTQHKNLYDLIFQQNWILFDALSKA